MKKLFAIFALVAFVGVIAAPAQDKNKTVVKKAVKTEVKAKAAMSEACCTEGATVKSSCCESSTGAACCTEGATVKSSCCESSTGAACCTEGTKAQKAVATKSKAKVAKKRKTK